MASSSSTVLSPQSLSPPNWLHHVFPSFHGADVRTNFLSHVLKELRSKGIDLFIDNNIERSKSIGPALIEAIKGSRIAIVLLSKNYASSTWCLNELVEIMKCREELGQKVKPLFYKVDPTDVKKQTGPFGKVFKKTCKGKKKEEIRRWKHALTEVAQIAGYHSTNWETEAEMIEDIATDVSKKLNLSAPCSDFDGLVGMESRMTEMRPLLQFDSNEVRKIGILGPPGIGKTTIARSLFNLHSKDFQLSAFIDNIKRNYALPACSDDYSVKLNLQKQFMSQLTNETSCVSISHLGVVKDRLKYKKVLVVLDDVDRSVQLEAMAKETSWFGPGSRIIVTTQDKNVLKASGIEHIHKMNLPRDDEALQIFCNYAFGQKYPKDGFEELAWKVTDLVGRLPLGLKVMGSYFRGMSEQDWKEALPMLKMHLDRDGEIANILKFSYDALNDEDKRLFLHIACFFNAKPISIVERCLEKCFEDVRQGLRVLNEKSLIDMDGMVQMAKLLVQLGRKIMRDESIREPGKRQFLNNANDIGEVLSDDKESNSNVIGINLDKDEKITYTSERAFERLSNLQFLKIHGRGINSRSLNYISVKLKVLIWDSFHKSCCFPSSFNPELLVCLSMRNSKVERLWKGNKPLSNLNSMELGWSTSLKELPDLSTATSLNYLDLSDCSSLVELPFSIGNAINLEKLNLSHCSSLVELPFSMRNLRKLSTLELNGCSKLEVVLANINLESLYELDLSDCSLLKSCTESSTEIEELDSWVGPLCRLVQRRMKELVSLPPLLPDLVTEIEELDPWARRNLRTLQLRGMKKLVSLPQLPDSLLYLNAENCESLERLDCCFPNLDIRLNFANCFKLNQQARDLIIHTPTKQYAVFPAEEVPQCFTHRSSGSSVNVKLNQTPLGKSTKFKAGIIFVGNDEFWGSICCNITSGRNASIARNKKVARVFPGHLLTFEVEVETEEVTSTELLFDFDISYESSSRKFKRFKIKECGIFQLPGPRLLSFRDVDEDFGPSDNEI